MTGRDEIEYGERVDLLHTPHRCRGRWYHPGETGAGGWQTMHVTVGELDDGRWYVDVSAQINQPARAYSGREAAWMVARNWMRTRGGGWTRVPCHPGQ